MPLLNYLKNLFKKEEITNPHVANVQHERSRARLQQSVEKLKQQRINLVKEIHKTKINLENAKRVKHKASILRNYTRIRTYQRRLKQLSDQISALESKIKNFNRSMQKPKQTLHGDNDLVGSHPLSRSTMSYRKLIVSDDDRDNEKHSETQDEDNNNEDISDQLLDTDSLKGDSEASFSRISVQNRVNLDKTNPISRQPQLINDEQSMEREIVLPVCKTNVTLQIKKISNSKNPECKFSIPNRDLKSNSQLTIMAMVEIAIRSGHFNECFVIKGNERKNVEALKALYTLYPDYGGRVLHVVNNQTKAYEESYTNAIRDSIKQDKQLVEYKNEIIQEVESNDEMDSLDGNESEDMRASM